MKTSTQECGCVIAYEKISRSMHVREIWLTFCPVHGAEEQAFRAEAQRGHNERARERALAEEFT
jgi:hypothetical protein